MRIYRRHVLTLTAGLGGLAVAGALANQIQIQDVPPTVRATIERIAAGDPVREIELEKEDGTLVYDVEILRDGEEVDFMVSTDGEFLGYEDDEHEEHEEGHETGEHDHGDEDEDEDGHEDGEERIALEELPAAVRTVALTIAGDGEITSVSREREDDATVYEIEYLVDGVVNSVEFSKTGDILETERAIGAEELPAAVRGELDEEFPGATFGEISAVQVYLYEIEVITEKGRREVKLLATGEEADED